MKTEILDVFCVDITQILAQEDERGNLLSTSYNATMAKASFQENL